jgi:predicted transcriptional regulator
MGMAQTELARRSGVPQPTINRILSGETGDPRGSTISKLRCVLGEDGEDVRHAQKTYVYADLVDAWAALLPDEQATLLADIQRRAAHNQFVLAQFQARRKPNASGKSSSTTESESLEKPDSA